MTSQASTQSDVTRSDLSQAAQAAQDDPIAATCELAESLLKAARGAMEHAEKRQSQQLSGLLHSERGKALTLAMVDEVFRSRRRSVQAEHWRDLLRDFGIPDYLPFRDRVLMAAGAAVSRVLPWLVMPFVEQRMRGDSARVILDGRPDRLQRHLRRRTADGFSLNLNQLGEAVLGEAEAARRLEAILRLMREPTIDYVSVKISAVYSQINLVAHDDTLTHIKDRLRTLCRASQQHGTFVNLDMEEYRDLDLTLSGFREVLDEPEFRGLSAGIVLQAYLPDSWPAQQELVRWAQRRVSNGGAPIKMRLVKGANLAMEAVEAELHGWSSAPYDTKRDTDANFRRMLEFGCRPEVSAAVRLGVASHNLFDVALALILRTRFGTTAEVEIEMLEGMANHQARAVRDAADGLLLYAPAVQPQDFLSAMAYLVRRLDENTAPENFLRDLFDLAPGSPEWHEQQQRFADGWTHRESVSSESRRASRPAAADPGVFRNEPDSDWTQADVRQRLHAAQELRVDTPLPPAADVEHVLTTAAEAAPQWAARPVADRAALLRQAADVMADDRYASIACLQQHGRKAIPEADAEVSEAIDFARYYARFSVPDDVAAVPRGVVTVTPPWNFPYAIPCGGVLAALMAGNAVILKPAPEVRAIGWHLAQQLWTAGIPRDVLQFAPVDDGPEARQLITDSRVNAVVLTGAWETAQMFRSWRPDLDLFAETSGKNALVVTARADRELAVKDLVRSAFSHSGQKCSAASLAVLEAEVYDDPVFRRQLKDAAESLPVGPATEPRNVVTPLVQKPGEALRRALTQLEPGESWLLEPRQDPDDETLWSPGIRLGVQPGSWFHQTECFGPVLGLMRAADLSQAISWQNATAYGLTAGLHSLDPREHRRWQDAVAAGNLYINRPITGAIVQRQPFGGWKRSSIGPGIKAGGPDYVSLFCHWHDRDADGSTESAMAAARDSYRRAWSECFSRSRDPTGLASESNVLRYRPCRGVLLRVPSTAADADRTAQRAKLAAELCGVPLIISTADGETDAEFARRIPLLADEFEYLRTIETPSPEVLEACFSCDRNWINAPVTACGRIELRYWVKEQAVCRTLHRYGQLPGWLPTSRAVDGR